MFVLLAALFTGAGMLVMWTGLTRSPQPLPAAESNLAEDEEDQADLDAEVARNRVWSKAGRRLGLESRQVRSALLYALPGAAGGGFLAYLIWNWPVLTFAGVLGGGAGPLWYLTARAAKQQLNFAEDLASAIDTMRTLLQFGGVGLTGAIAALADRGPGRLRSEFRTIYEDASLYGLEQALSLSQSRLADPQFDLVALALVTADRAGSRVGGVLDSLSRTIRANLAIKRQIQAEQVKQVLSARLVALVPLGIITLLKLTGSAYTDAFDTFLGQVVLIIALGFMLAGYVMMRALSGLPRERRTFK